MQLHDLLAQKTLSPWLRSKVVCGQRFESFTGLSPELLCALTRERPGRPKVSGDGAGVRERSHNPDQAMTRTDKILTAMGGVFVVIGAVAVSAAPITPARFNPAVEAQANRWHQDQHTRFHQQYNVDGPAAQRWQNNRI